MDVIPKYLSCFSYFSSLLWHNSLPHDPCIAFHTKSKVQVSLRKLSCISWNHLKLLTIWKIEKRGLGNEAGQESMNGPECPMAFCSNDRKYGQAQASPLPSSICRVFLDLFRNSLKALAKASLVTHHFQVLDFLSHIFSSIFSIPSLPLSAFVSTHTLESWIVFLGVEVLLSLAA